MHDTRTATLALSTVAVAIAAALCSQPAGAITSTATAVNACTPALPAYEGLVRKRPLAMQNEGSAAAFITCSLAASSTLDFGALYTSSIDGQPHTMACTAVIGFAGGGPLRYVTKTITLPASGAVSLVNIEPVDVGSTTGDLESIWLSFSCLVAPGTGINGFVMGWT